MSLTPGCPRSVPLLPKLRGQFAEFLRSSSLKRLGMLYLTTCVGFGYGLCWSYFQGQRHCREQSNKPRQLMPSVTSSWCRNIYLLPIDYAFQPRLRGRLTLRRLALRRNPWSFGGSVSHTPIVTHVSILTSDTSSRPRDRPSPAYGTLRYRLQ